MKDLSAKYVYLASNEIFQSTILQIFSKRVRKVKKNPNKNGQCVYQLWGWLNGELCMGELSLSEL